MLPAATPVTMPPETVATAVSSEVMAQSAASIPTLLYSPPFMPMTEMGLVPPTARAMTAGVAAMSLTAIVDAALGISEM